MTLIRPTIKLLAAGCTLLSGCSLAPKYQRPAAPVAATYSLDASTASTPAVAATIAARGAERLAVELRGIAGQITAHRWTIA